MWWGALLSRCVKSCIGDCPYDEIHADIPVQWKTTLQRFGTMVPLTPDGKITREEFVTIIYRYVKGFKGRDGGRRDS